MTYNVLMGTLNPTHSLTHYLPARNITSNVRRLSSVDYDGSLKNKNDHYRPNLQGAGQTPKPV